MSLEQIIECVQTYYHQAHDDYDAFYLGRYAVRDDGTTLSIASDDWCAERNGDAWHYRGITEREFKEFCEDGLPSPYYPVEEAHDLLYAPKMTEDGYKPFLQARSDVATEFSKVKVVRCEEDFLIFAAWYDGEHYHHKKYRAELEHHMIDIFANESKLLAETLGYGIEQ